MCGKLSAARGCTEIFLADFHAILIASGFSAWRNPYVSSQ